ncbi:MAG TPA: hypothetical protein DEB39_15585 [Planctomycetaceae bacterium]|nr:hypothetical protein [Planctomycetaceae bacterium]
MVLVEPPTRKIVETTNPPDPGHHRDETLPEPKPPAETFARMPPPPPVTPSSATPAEGGLPPEISRQEARLRKILLQLLVVAIVLLLLGSVLVLFFGGEADPAAVPLPPGLTSTVSDEPEDRVDVETVPADDPADVPVNDMGDDRNLPVDQPGSQTTETSVEPEMIPEREDENDDNGSDAIPDGPDAKEEPPADPAEETADPRSAQERQNRLVRLLQPRRDDTAALVAIAPRLEWMLGKFQFENLPLYEVVRTLSGLIDVPVTFDLASLSTVGVSVEDRISANLENRTVRETLESLLEPRQLRFFIRNGGITIAGPPDPVEEHRFAVEDLLATIPPERLTDMLFTLVRPDFLPKPVELSAYPPIHLPGRVVSGGQVPERSASGNFNRFPYQSDDGQAVDTVPVDAGLVDAAPQDGHHGEIALFDNREIRLRGNRATADRVLKVLEMLRVLRELPQQSEMSGETLTPEAFGWDTVRRPFTLNYFRPVPLVEAVALIETNAPLIALVDYDALSQSGASIKELVSTVHCDDGTLDDALTGLLDSVEAFPLSYRIVAKNMIEISTPSDLGTPSKMSLEPHLLPLSIRTLSDPEKNDAIESFLRMIRATLEPESWQSAGNPFGGAICVDEGTKTLFVRQSQPLQRRLRRIIAEMDAEPNTPGAE